MTRKKRAFHLSKPRQHPPAMVEAVKASYLSGRYSRIAELAAAHNLSNLNTLKAWIRRGGWKNERDEIVAAAEAGVRAKIQKSLERVSLSHLRAADSLLDRVVKRIGELSEGKEEKPSARITEEIESLTRSLARIQDIHRKALGERDDPRTETVSQSTTVLAIFQQPDVRRACQRVIDRNVDEAVTTPQRGLWGNGGRDVEEMITGPETAGDDQE